MKKKQKKIKNSFIKNQWRICFLAVCVFLLCGYVKTHTVLAKDNWEIIQQKQQELNAVQKKINNLDGEIQKKTSEMSATEKEIALMENDIQMMELQGEETQIFIEQIDVQIQDVADDISNKEAVIEYKKDIIKEYLQQIYEEDNTTFLETFLSGEQLSQAWTNLQFAQELQDKIKEALIKVKQDKQDLDRNKKVLDDQHEEQNQLYIIHEAQKAAVQSDKNRKDSFVKVLQSKKNNLKSDKESVEQIKKVLKDEIYSLKSAGVSMSMQSALDFAQFASNKTGVRPAFLLGLMKVESNLGNNIGSGNYKTDMRSTQHEAFLSITNKLGLDPNTTPVSKRPKSYKGWGGAMGPAQMMPRTWLGYEAEVSALTGNNPASPWDTKDAFTAAALRLSRTGANDGTRDGEWKAAMKYLAGSNWDNPKLAWYGDRVLKLAATYEL